MTFKLEAVGQQTKSFSYSYDWRDTVLYALGVGAKKNELDYLYEERGPKVLPSFAVVPAFAPVMQAIEDINGPMDKVVHGAQRVTIHREFPKKATLHTTAVVEGLYDMKRMTQTIVKTQTRNSADNELLCETTWSIIFLGIAGFNTATRPDEERPSAPSRAPDFTVEEQTLPEQALLYRLSGDVNPLHADPEFPLVSRFEGKPILHGLATYGFMVRAVIQSALNGKGEQVKAIQGRFSKPVWPGETLITESWVEGKRIFARTSVKERNEVVLSHCALDID